eukprot:scaffold5613_cov133-Isochrysis_galbana.AAC.8
MHATCREHSGQGHCRRVPRHQGTVNSLAGRAVCDAMSTQSRAAPMRSTVQLKAAGLRRVVIIGDRHLVVFLVKGRLGVVVYCVRCYRRPPLGRPDLLQLALLEWVGMGPLLEQSVRQGEELYGWVLRLPRGSLQHSLPVPRAGALAGGQAEA